MASIVPPEKLVTELLRGTQAMDAGDGSGPTNEMVFDAVFYPALEREKAELAPIFDRFYADEFPKLQAMTHPIPEARLLVEWAFERGLQVVIATNPMFPRTAVEQRLAWADVPVTEFDYALVTTYEVMHATKAHPAYYREILDLLGREPKECLVVGDDWQMDMAPAASIGIPIYWVTRPDDTLLPIPPLGVGERRGGVLIGQGTLESLWDWMGRGGLAV
jgi:FMN phosphatase YigB (HAD superfamily)